MSTRTERQDNKALNDLHSRILKELMQRSDNRKCVDCRKRDPRWASWNLGVFMCIRCSGIHRSLGTHITKVKSADLDTWTPEQIENMKRWGNARANLYWEHDWPRDMDPPEGNIEQFIRAKYERKQYAMRGPIPDPESLTAPGQAAAESTPQRQPQSAVRSSASPASVDLLGVGAAAHAAQPAQPQPQPSASQQLFDAFQSAPVAQQQQQQQQHQQQQQQQSAVKNSILSLYNAPNAAQAARPSGLPQQPSFTAFGAAPVPAPQPAFANFASFGAPAATATQLPIFTQPLAAVTPAVSASAPVPPLRPSTASSPFGEFSSFQPTPQAGIGKAGASAEIPDFVGFQQTHGSAQPAGVLAQPVRDSSLDDWSAFQ